MRVALKLRASGLRHPEFTGIYTDRYEKLKEQFLAFVEARNHKLLPLAELLTDELSKSEAARELGDAWGTVTSRADKLKELLTEFLEDAT